MNVVLLAAMLFTLFSNACTDLWKDQSKQNENSKQQETPCAARYVPVGNNPEIALDTQTGTLCRTIADTNDPLGIRDSACGVSQQEKKSGFVPSACRSGETWAKGEGDKNPSRYTSLPNCSAEPIEEYVRDPKTGKLVKK
jgi:hypothetical protein